LKGQVANCDEVQNSNLSPRDESQSEISYYDDEDEVPEAYKA